MQKKILYMVWGKKLQDINSTSRNYMNEYRAMINVLNDISNVTVVSDNWKEINFEDYDLIFIHSASMNFFGGAFNEFYVWQMEQVSKTSKPILYWRVDTDHHLTPLSGEFKKAYDCGWLSKDYTLQTDKMIYISPSNDIGKPKLYQNVQFKETIVLPTTLNIYKDTPVEWNPDNYQYAMSFGSYNYKSTYRLKQSHLIAQVMSPSLFHWKLDERPFLNEKKSITYLEEPENYQTFIENMKKGMFTLIIGRSDKVFLDMWYNRFAEAIENNVLPIIDYKSMSEFAEKLPDGLELFLVNTDTPGWDVKLKQNLAEVANSEIYFSYFMNIFKNFCKKEQWHLKDRLKEIIERNW